MDAVTGQARAFREYFDRWGWMGEDRAVWRDPRARDIGGPEGFDPADDDVLLVHYSAYAPRLRPLLGRPNPKLLVHHNVTPARWLWTYDALLAVQCEVGRAQLGEWARGVDLACGVSEYNTGELREAGARRVEVLPLLVDPGKLGAAAPATAVEPGGPPTLLFVGRLVPHKRHDELIRTLALLRAGGGRDRFPDVRLVCVGEPLSESYRRSLVRLGEELAPGAITWESGLSGGELADRYRSAHAFLCLSEHEGFCIPLLEAFHFGLPVVARAAGAVPEVAGEAALLLGSEDDALVAAEAASVVLADAGLREELRAHGRRRLEAYRPEDTARALRAAVESVTRRSDR